MASTVGNGHGRLGGSGAVRRPFVDDSSPCVTVTHRAPSGTNSVDAEPMKMPNRSSCVNTSDVNRLISVENAKILALVIVIGAMLYHGIIRYRYGTDSCQWLLENGRFQGYGIWQPYGCMMHKFSKSDSLNCMRYISYWGGKNDIAFVGDSRIRQLYYEFIGLLSNEEIVPEKKHANLSFTDPKSSLQVRFIWSPLLNASMLSVYDKWIGEKPDARPKVVITGCATWSIKKYNASEDAYLSFKHNLTLLVPKFQKLTDSTKVIWMMQDPVVESQLNPNRSMITNRQIDLYNRAAYEQLVFTSVRVWSSSRLIAQGYTRESIDGLHAGKNTIAWDVQILLNMYCNDHMNFNDGTCCTTVETATTTQLVMAMVFILSFIIMVVMAIWHYKSCLFKAGHGGTPVHSDDADDGSHCTDSTAAPPSADVTEDTVTVGNGTEGKKPDWVWEIATSLSRLGLIMLYFFLCDRTTFFMKENKYYTHMNFFLPFSYLMILGLFFTENTKQTSILHRDITDEWKGWMQLVILIYHLTGASNVLPIYMQIRVMVSSYLFLSGFGHFYYFFTKGDHSFHRFLMVLVRMNFLVITLCLVMNRPYQFYYFVPLVSYWFVVVYLFMTVWPRVSVASIESNSLHYLFMVLKFAALAAAITLTYSSEVFFEKIFLIHPLRALFVSADDSISDWRFRWSLDRYSTLYGMLFAFGMLIGRRLKMFNEANGESVLESRKLTWLLCLLSIVGIGVYGTFTALCQTKQQCNSVHSYIAFIPILSYLCLRNLRGWLRTKYSAFFAWFGRVSLELFIGQYHIWLAADTHGLLVLIPGYPVMNVVVTSFVFVCISHDIHCITERLVPYLVPDDCRRLARNIVCLSVAFLPLAVSRGIIFST